MKTTLPIVLLTLLLLIITACTESSPIHTSAEKEEKNREESTGNKKSIQDDNNDSDAPEYSVVKTKEIEGTSVYHYYVIPDDIYNVSEDEIRQISHKVVEQAKEQIAFHTIVLLFIADKIDIDRTYNIAHVIYSPTQHVDLDEIDGQNYEDYDYTYTFGSEFNGKLPRDDENYPTKKERKIYYFFFDQYMDWDLNSDDGNESDGKEFLDEMYDQAMSETVDHFDISSEEVEEILKIFNKDLPDK